MGQARSHDSAHYLMDSTPPLFIESTVAKKVPKKSTKNLYIVGDIHGCYSEFLKLEQKVLEHIIADESPVNPKQLPEDFLVLSVGDLIDRGPDSAWVLEHFCKGTALGTHGAVLGNHEAIFLCIVAFFHPELFKRARAKLPPWIKSVEEEYGVPRKIRAFHGKGLDHFANEYLAHWMRQGGLETFSSLGWDLGRASTWKLPSPILKWMCALPPHWETSEAFVTHGLITKSDAENLKQFNYKKSVSTAKKVKDRDLKLLNQIERTIWHRDVPIAAPLEQKWHFSGHTPVRDVVIDSELQIVRLDTGCTYGNRLSAFHVRSGSILEVPSETKWISPEQKKALENKIITP